MPNSVLVVGAGPTGLMMAAELGRHGVLCRIIDPALAPSEKSKAIAIQARTLEIFALTQLADEFVAAGHPAHGASIHANGKLIAHIEFRGLESAYPYLLMLPQPDTERILGDRVRQLGVTVERGVELTSLSQTADHVAVDLHHADGTTESARFSWVIGCDGAHSKVRHDIAMPFEGHAFQQQFLLADVTVDWSFSDDEAQIFTRGPDILAIFPLGHGRYRIIADNPPARATGSTQDSDPTLEECQAIVNQRASVPMTLRDSRWTANFRVNSRLVRKLRDGRVFLAGDSAHIHSPAGGQGMNTGIQDVVNLAWKLALVCKDSANEVLLDSYHAERYPVERSVVRLTDVMFSFASADNMVATFLKKHVASHITALDIVQRRIRRIVSQINIEYESSPIVEDHYVTGGLRAGCRAPDAIARLAPDGSTIHVMEVCSRPEFTLLLLVNSDDDVTLAESVARRVDSLHGAEVTSVILADIPAKEYTDLTPTQLPHPDTWTPKPLSEVYGITRPAMYLIRPDGYIAFRAPVVGDAPELMRYLELLTATARRSAGGG